jgi:PDZ domain-containing protein
VSRIVTPFRVLMAAIALFFVAALLYLVPSDEYVFLPDRARPLAPFVNVKGERDDHDGGGIYYVAVEVRKASLLEKLFHGLHEGATLVPANQVLSPDESEKQHQREELRAMAESQKIGAAVALQALGYHVGVKSRGTVIEAVATDGPSANKIKPGDTIVAIDGRPTPLLPQLRRAISAHKPGEAVNVKVRHGDATRTVKVKTVRDPRDPSRPIIGVQASCAQGAGKISLPVPVRIDLGRVGGPSAGLAFALDVAEELGHDIDHGLKVAASGELCLDGTVTPVGGVKQKTIGARRAGMDIFLVPVGENAKEARRHAGDMKVVPVESFRQALLALTTEARNRSKS